MHFALLVIVVGYASRCLSCNQQNYRCLYLFYKNELLLFFLGVILNCVLNHILITILFV